MDRDIFKQKLCEIAVVKQNADARDGRSRGFDLEDHPLCVIDLLPVKTQCQDCERWCPRRPHRSFEHKAGLWRERCECGRQRDLTTGRMITGQEAKRLVSLRQKAAGEKSDKTH